ncbi:Pc22g16200 [Penicillium rubens Wisconsin 54-1255]|uniref:Pc22g16200 protein n=1 Tax=Penicillium rubens (strain ATCC 28089 / DSM 1075 / NRRL 1951 / Wisconsin 54-1255) TaxID=500485 RepID=B6HQR5_PENRW|nr:Pc22g16200 [Penicillium rubens Wisconsin 54-1255]
MRQRKLYDFLAILIFTSCTIEAARTFTIKLLAQTTSPDLYALPAERKTLTEIFGEQVTPDKFMTQQACFCPIVICNKKEVRIPSLDRQCLPYLEQKVRGKGAYGTVYQVKIAKGHFYDSDIRGTNQQPKEMARKDYQSTEDMEQGILKKILACDRTCPNIVDIYGSLSIGTNYSIFMPLAICDLSAHMKEDNRTRPYTTAEKADIIHCARGLARGLEFLHNGMRTAEGDRIVCYHMDLKPSNILVFLENVGDKQGFVWKISDFGMSRLKLKSRREETDFDSWFVRFQQPRDVSASATYNRRGDGGTYLGPESLSPHRAMRTANDIWSLGCVLSIVFAYLEEGSSGVERYRERRRKHRASDGDRFFVTNSLFSRPRIHPEVTEWHEKLIKKARKRSSKEGEALRSMLDYLEREVLQPDQLKRCKADQLEEKLLDTHRKYKELENEGGLSLPEEESGLGSRLRRKRIDVLIGKKPATDRSVERWYLREPEPFKGCEISPDGTVIAFWTDTKISLYTSQSLEQEEVDIVRPAAEYPIPIRECRWKSISLTRKHLIASTSGGTFQCYIFKLRRGLVGMDVNLRHGDRISLPTLPEIKKVALAPGGQRLACVVSDKDEDQNPGSLYIGSIHSPYDWQLGNKLDWPAADVVQLSFSTDEDLHMVFRPQRSGPNRKHEIPVIHVSLRTNQLCPLIIEPQVSLPLCSTSIVRLISPMQGFESSSTVGLFTTFAPLSQKPHVCVLVTREKQLHIQSLAQLDKTAAIQADIKNYRVLKLMMGKDDEKIFAVGRRAAHHKMLLLEVDMPLPQETKISVTELAEIPGLAYSDDFAERVVHGESESVVILAALMGANQCGIYKITVPSSRSGTSAAA